MWSNNGKVDRTSNQEIEPRFQRPHAYFIGKCISTRSFLDQIFFLSANLNFSHFTLQIFRFKYQNIMIMITMKIKVQNFVKYPAPKRL